MGSDVAGVGYPKSKGGKETDVRVLGILWYILISKIIKWYILISKIIK
jgi:hypothetical protein